MRSEALQILYAGVKELITFDDFERGMRHWEVIPLKRGGELVGCFAVNGKEVHIAYTKPLFIRSHIRTIFKPLFDLRGEFITSVRETNERGQWFCHRMGFMEVGRKNGIIYLQCKRLNYV